MRDWLQALHDELQIRGAPVVRVVVAAVRGSAPREPGASMLVTPTRELGTIGGGHLELVATRTAREKLEPEPGSDPGQSGVRPGSERGQAPVLRFSLGASLGQCCGGIVDLWFQRYDATDIEPLARALRMRDKGASTEAIAAIVSRDPQAARYERFFPELTRLWLFGAGHVGKALVHVLSPLPFDITWIDSREDMWPGELPSNVRALHAPDPAAEVADMPKDAWALVLTHSHDEDFAICQALLRNARFGWAGVIGSGPKTTRFRQRLLQRGFTADQVARLTMPIGIGGIRSKEAAAIAVAVAAQLLQVREARAALEVPVVAKRRQDPKTTARES